MHTIFLWPWGDHARRGKGFGLEVNITQNLNGEWSAGVWLGNWHMLYDGGYSELRHAITGTNRFLRRIGRGDVRVAK